MDIYSQSLGPFKVGVIFDATPKNRIAHSTAFYHTQLRDSLYFGHTPYSADLYINDTAQLVHYNTFTKQVSITPPPLLSQRIKKKELSLRLKKISLDPSKQNGRKSPCLLYVSR